MYNLDVIIAVGYRVSSYEGLSLVPLFHVFVQTAVFQLLNKAFPLSFSVVAH